MRAAKERNLDMSTVEEFDSPTGKGATGKIDGKTVLLVSIGKLDKIEDLFRALVS